MRIEEINNNIQELKDNGGERYKRTAIKRPKSSL